MAQPVNKATMEDFQSAQVRPRRLKTSTERKVCFPGSCMSFECFLKRKLVRTTLYLCNVDNTNFHFLATTTRVCFICAKGKCSLHQIHHIHLEKVKLLGGKDPKKLQKLEKASSSTSKPNIYICCDHLEPNHPESLADDSIQWFKSGMDGKAFVSPTLRPANKQQAIHERATSSIGYAADPRESPVGVHRRNVAPEPIPAPNFGQRSPPVKDKLLYSELKQKTGRLKELEVAAIEIAGSKVESQLLLTDYYEKSGIGSERRMGSLKQMIGEFKSSCVNFTLLEVAVFAFNAAKLFDVALTQKLASEMCEISQATASRAVVQIALIEVCSF